MFTLTRRKVEILLLWIIPFVALIGAYFYWVHLKALPFSFVLFTFLLPTFFGYLVVVPCTGPWKLWAWKLPYSIKGTILPSIGFLWAGYMVLPLILITELITISSDSLSALSLIKVGVINAILFASICTNFDMIMMQLGALEVYPIKKKYKKHGVPGSVASYSFAFFGAVGMVYGILTKAAHFYLVEQSGVYNPSI